MVVLNPSRRWALRAIATGSLVGVVGCLEAPRIATAPPTFAPKGESKCTVTASQLEPLVAEWPSAARGELEARLRKGVVPVRFTGCELEVLPRCATSVSYAYTGTTRKRDLVTVRDASELYARLPRGAARLEGELSRSGELDVSMTVVGRFEAERAAIGADELHGECATATHVVSAVAVGAFDFYAAGKANVKGSVGVGDAGVGGSSAAEHRSLQMDGDENACAKATRDDKAPPDGCGAVIRLQLAPLGESSKLAPVCPPGSDWDGKACVRKQVVTEVECPAGSKWDGRSCVGAEGPEGRPSPDGLHVGFKADAGDDWQLLDASGALVCKLPCTHWVTPTSGNKLRKGPDGQVIPIESFNHVAPGQDAEATFERNTFAGWGLVGFVMEMTGIPVGVGSVFFANGDTRALGMIGIGAGVGLVVTGIVLQLAASPFDVRFALPARNSAAPGWKWHLTASGVGLSF